ncbi:hypothetical protein INO58_14465, partial [Staphylococcus aureus]|nr:hypothetical protein [Staphylococcus aureus]
EEALEEEDDYDTWANMMAMRLWAQPLSTAFRGLGARDAVEAFKAAAPATARALGFFAREPPVNLAANTIIRDMDVFLKDPSAQG